MRTPDSWQTARATVAIAVVTAISYVIVSVFGVERQAIELGSFIPAVLGLELDFTGCRSC
jgi:hypothetical protein